MHDKISSQFGLDEQQKKQLVEELSLAKRGVAKSARPVGTAIAVTVRPADSMSRPQVAATGITRELRTRSLMAQLSQPVMIGSFYELQFDDTVGDLPTAFARCDQITMLAEDRFDVRFQFLQPFVLPGQAGD